MLKSRHDTSIIAPPPLAPSFSTSISRRGRRLSRRETLTAVGNSWRTAESAIGSSTRPPRVRQFDVLIYQLVSPREQSSLVPGISISPLITDSSVFHTRLRFVFARRVRNGLRNISFQPKTKDIIFILSYSKFD